MNKTETELMEACDKKVRELLGEICSFTPNILTRPRNDDTHLYLAGVTYAASLLLFKIFEIEVHHRKSKDNALWQMENALISLNEVMRSRIEMYRNLMRD